MSRTLPIQKKLISSIVILNIAVMLLTSVLWYFFQQRALIQSNTLNGESAVKSLAVQMAYPLSQYEFSRIQLGMQSLFFNSSVVYVGVIDPKLQVVLDQSRSNFKPDPQLISQFKKHDFSAKTLMVYEGKSEGLSVWYYAFPIFLTRFNGDESGYTFESEITAIEYGGFPKIGYAVIGLNESGVKSVANDSLKWILVISIFGLGGLILWVIFQTNWMLAPLRALQENLITAYSGDHIHAMTMEPSGEMGDIVKSFNAMIHDIQTSHQRLDDYDQKMELKILERTGEMELKTMKLQAAFEKAKESDRLKSEFLANMSHELRTPLNAIIGFSDVLLAGIDGEINDSQRNDIQLINISGNHLLTLINSILDIAKIESGKMEMHYEEIDLVGLIENVYSISRALIKDKELALQVDIVADIPKLVADETKLRQILLNLMSNAIKFTEAGSVVTKIVMDDGHFLFEVRDTGIGIREEDMDKVFEKFRQIDGSLTREKGGTGLGMALVKELVQIHGGKIWIKSEVGHGTSFFFTLPVRKL